MKASGIVADSVNGHQENLKNNPPTALTIGKFDGFHLGHQVLLDDIIKESNAKGYRSVCLKIVTKDSGIFSKEDSIFTEVDDNFFFRNLNKKINCLLDNKQNNKQNNIQNIIQNNMTSSRAEVTLDYLCLDDICSMTPEEFVKDILVERYNVKFISVGQDFRFGAKRSGDVNILKELGRKYGFQCSIHEKLCQGDEVVSSSRIRQNLAEGNIEKVNELLGRDYSVLGDVEAGKQLGRTFGYPTINVSYEKDRLLPRFGVYASKVKIFGSGSEPDEYKGITNIGIRPSVDDGDIPTVETFILDYSGEEIYARRVLIELEHFVRPEKKFASLDELTKQIALDIESVKSNIKHQ